MWDLPRPGLEPVFPALAGRFSTTAPPGKPVTSYFISFCFVYPFTYDGYGWFYYFCLLTFLLASYMVDLLLSLYISFYQLDFSFHYFHISSCGLLFSTREVPLTFFVKLVWWCQTLSFCLVVNILISPWNLMKALLVCRTGVIAISHLM